MRGTMKEIQEYFQASHFALVNSSILVNLPWWMNGKETKSKQQVRLSFFPRNIKKDILDRLTLQMGQ